MALEVVGSNHLDSLTFADILGCNKLDLDRQSQERKRAVSNTVLKEHMGKELGKGFELAANIDLKYKKNCTEDMMAVVGDMGTAPY